MSGNKFVLAIYVDNEFGVLSRITNKFTSRGFNIDTLTVGETENPVYSRITITLSGDGYARNQLIQQLRKLQNVRKIEILDDDALARELLLIKIKNDKETRSEALAAIEIFDGKIVDYSTGALLIEVTGNTKKVDSFVEIVKPYGIIEMCRTGTVAMARGDGTLKDK